MNARPSATQVVCLLTLLAAPALQAADWRRFRGENGSGVSQDSHAAPTTWSPTENLQWTTALPGPGSSSPIVVGDKVFLTCWSGYGVDRREPGKPEDLRRHLVCVARKTGKILWDRAIPAVLPEDTYEGMFAEHGYASHTPISDGERVYVFFGKSGVFGFDLQGEQLWQADVGQGTDPRNWGSASSPILYRNLLIVTAAAESTSLVALDKLSGKEVWRKSADGFGSTWGTPVLVKVNDERTDLVLGVPYEIWGFNPETGKFVWYCEAMDTNSYCSSVVTDGQMVYGIESMGGGSIAVRVGGKDDVTKTHVVWSGRDNGRIGTPLLHEGRLYSISRRIVTCLDAKSGERIYQSRLQGGSAPAGGSATAGRAPGGFRPGGEGSRGGPPGGRAGFGGGLGGQDYGSPIAADGKLYYVARNGDMFVLKLGPEFEQLAVNRVTTESEDFTASPAISDGQLFVRSNKHLYCVAAE